MPEFEQADENFIGSRSPRDPGETVSARIDIDLALTKLPEEFRAPVVLRDIAGLDYAEIADVLNLAPGTVRSRIARGRGRLADTLTPGRETGNQIDPDERQSP